MNTELFSEQVFELIQSRQMTLEQFQDWLENRLLDSQSDGFDLGYYATTFK